MVHTTDRITISSVSTLERAIAPVFDAGYNIDQSEVRRSGAFDSIQSRLGKYLKPEQERPVL